MFQIISANRLTDGRIVFRDASGSWGQDIAAAARFTSKEDIAAALEAARADVAANLVVDVEPVEIREEHGVATPVTMRDRIRVAGPSILMPQGEAPVPVKSEQNDVSI